MTRPVRHADLVARAAGVLEGADRDRVDRALSSDPALREEFEAVAAHLLMYDDLGDVPPPPAVEGVLDRIENDRDAAGRLSRRDLPRPVVFGPRPMFARVAWAATALIVVGAAIALIVSAAERREESVEVIRTIDGIAVAELGAGIEVLRDGAPIRRIPAGSSENVVLDAFDVVQCDRAAELRLGERIHVVLDADSPLVLTPTWADEGPAVSLSAGRAVFDIAPGPFAVQTPHGVVRVLGTRFEVDLRFGRLDVHVAEGTVEVTPPGDAAEAIELTEGQRLDPEGRATATEEPVAPWLAAPVLEVRPEGAASLRLGQALDLRLELSNPHHVRMEAPGPAADRNALYVVIQRMGPDGTWKGNEQPWTVTEENILSGESVVRPGEPVILGGRERRGVTLRLLSPFRDPGTYRVRVGYHPAGRSPVMSAPLEIEVAR